MSRDAPWPASIISLPDDLKGKASAVASWDKYFFRELPRNTKEDFSVVWNEILDSGVVRVLLQLGQLPPPEFPGPTNVRPSTYLMTPGYIAV